MKQCPNCKKAYADDLFFCLDDGTELKSIAAVSPTAPTVANIQVDRSPVTEIIPRVITTETKKSSAVPYIAIGALAMLCIGLFVVLGLLYFGRDQVATNDTKTAQTPTPGVSPTPVTQPTSVVIAGDSPTPKPASSVTAFDPAGRWSGQWSTDSGSLYDIEVGLSVSQDNRLDGQIRWTMRRTALPNKTDKIGLSATEYVRGSFDPSTGVVNFSGYRKDDPNSMLVMLDAYKLNISKDGKTMNGAARNGGKWNGRVKLSR